MAWKQLDRRRALVGGDAVARLPVRWPGTASTLSLRRPGLPRPRRVASEHSEIEAEATYVDAMSLYMVQNPSAYDVMVMENQFGDILSDLGAGIVGGLGMAPSAEIGEEHALFQPSG